MGDKIAIMGPGAVGSFVGAHFVREGEDVTFIDMWPEHVETMRSKGLRASSVDKGYVLNLRGRAMMILGLDDPVPPSVLEEIKALPQIYDARLVAL